MTNKASAVLLHMYGLSDVKFKWLKLDGQNKFRYEDNGKLFQAVLWTLVLLSNFEVFFYFFGLISRWKSLECLNELNMNLSDRVQSTEVWIEYFKNPRNTNLDKIQNFDDFVKLVRIQVLFQVRVLAAKTSKLLKTET